MEKDIEFLEQEHKGGFHNTYTEKCYECYKENRLIRTYGIVNQPEVMPVGWGQSIINKIIWGDDARFYNK
jgi:hypothetical protein